MSLGACAAATNVRGRRLAPHQARPRPTGLIITLCDITRDSRTAHTDPSYLAKLDAHRRGRAPRAAAPPARPGPRRRTRRRRAARPRAAPAPRPAAWGLPGRRAPPARPPPGARAGRRGGLGLRGTGIVFTLNLSAGPLRQGGRRPPAVPSASQANYGRRRCLLSAADLLWR